MLIAEFTNNSVLFVYPSSESFGKFVNVDVSEVLLSRYFRLFELWEELFMTSKKASFRSDRRTADTKETVVKVTSAKLPSQSYRHLGQ